VTFLPSGGLFDTTELVARQFGGEFPRSFVAASTSRRERRRLVNRTVAWALVALVTLLTHLAKDRASAQSIEVRSYQILPGSMYTYKPSPWVGIPGGMPDPFRLEFGVDGAFDVEFDDTADTARLVNMQLALTGNEAVQMNPPLISPVTADRVEDRLEERVLHNQFVAGPHEQYKDSV
jgi:hypothetical protein